LTSERKDTAHPTPNEWQTRDFQRSRHHRATRSTHPWLCITRERISIDHGLIATNRDRPGLCEALASVRAGELGEHATDLGEAHRCTAGRADGLDESITERTGCSIVLTFNRSSANRSWGITRSSVFPVPVAGRLRDC